MDCCERPPSGALLRACGEFNRGDWFACHETLEDLWLGTEGEIRDFYQGLLQIAVALHHWRNGNFTGAMLLLTSGPDKLRRVRSACQRIDVARMVVAADRFRERLAELGAERMAELEPELLPRMELVKVETDCRADD